MYPDHRRDHLVDAGRIRHIDLAGDDLLPAGIGSRASASARARSRSATQTFAPDAAANLTAAAPIPDAPFVTSSTLPAMPSASGISVRTWSLGGLGGANMLLAS